MKKTVIICALFLCSYSAISQIVEVKYGIKAGVNAANISSDFIEDTDPKLGLHIGVLAEISIVDRFAIQPELLFSSQGYKLNYSEISTGANENIAQTYTSVKYDYINLPVMLKFIPFKGFNIQAGPQVGVLISAVETTSIEIIRNGITVSETEGKNTIEEGLKNLDYGVNFGVGYELGIGLFFDLRYNLGLSNINDFSDFDENLLDEYETTNEVLQLSVGFKF